jgi:hypothetical protein
MTFISIESWNRSAKGTKINFLTSLQTKTILERQKTESNDDRSEKA